MKTVLLTGANGFLGSHLLEVLAKNDYQVVILKRSSSNCWRIKHLLNNIKSYDVDKEPIENAFKDQHIDSVIHTACHYGRDNNSLSDVVDSNLLFGVKVLDCCIKYNTDTFFNTDTLLQKHLNVYSLSKKQFVEWLSQKSDKVKIVNLKLEHMYGKKDDPNKFISWVLSQFEQKAPEIKLTEGEQKRDFIYITDVVSAYITVLTKKSYLPRFSEFDVGYGELITIKHFLKKLQCFYEEEYGKVLTKLNFGAIPYREGEMMTVEVDNRRLLELGWKPKITLEKGLRLTIEDLL